MIQLCNKCNLHKTRTTQVVGEGNPASPVYFIGEAPGQTEDLTGLPFQGSAGSLLSGLLAQAKITRKNCYMDNIVKCRPVIIRKSGEKENRIPSAAEIELCCSSLEDTIAKNHPKVIVAVGNVALKYLSRNHKANIIKFRGQFIWSEKYQCHIFPIFHPAIILNKFEHYPITLADLQRLYQFIVDGYALPPRRATNYVLVDKPEDVMPFLEKLASQDVFSFDLETTGLDFLTAEILCINFSWVEGGGYILPIAQLPVGEVPIKHFWDDSLYPQIQAKLKEIFAGTAMKIAHNIKYDAKVLKHNGYELSSPTFDTLLAHYMLDENLKGMRKLKHLAWDFTDMGGYDQDLVKYQTDHKLGDSFAQIPYSVMLKYGAGDANCTFRLYKIFSRKLEEEGMTKLFSKLVMPLSTVYFETEYHGIQLDIPHVQSLGLQYKAHIDQMLTDIRMEAAMPDLNVNSTKQLRELLFEKLQLKSPKQTKKDDASTDASVLKKLAKKHKIPRMLLAYRKAHKIYTTYINGIEYDANNVVHTEYNMMATTSGRLSSSNPNLQNIPHTKEMKNMFRAREGYTLVEGDFAQIEFRMWAHYSNDQKMIQEIVGGLDIHRKVASAVFNIPYEEIGKDSDERRMAKTAVFGLMFGRGAKAISEEFKISLTQAYKISNTFLSMYPTARRWLDSIVLQAKRDKFLVNFFGRRRRLYAFNSQDEEVVAGTERQAKNFLMQSTASDITNYTAVRMRDIAKKYGAQLVINVHDCLMFEVPDVYAVEFAQVLQTEAQRTITGIRIPTPMDVKLGKSWGSTEKLKDVLCIQSSNEVPG